MVWPSPSIYGHQNGHQMSSQRYGWIETNLLEALIKSVVANPQTLE